MVEITLTVDGNSALLLFGPNTLNSVLIEERLREVLPLLKILLEADVAKVGLPDLLLNRRLRGIMAQSMMVEAVLSSTTAQAELLFEIVSGRESIVDHGFPEFGDE